MENYLVIRGLKEAKHTVFCVGEDGLKTYFDPIFNRLCAFASGQQVKRAFLADIGSEIKQELPHVTFVKVVKKKDGKITIGEGNMKIEPDIENAFHLLGGYWKSKETEGDGEENGILNRRSPHSISSMSPVHPFLATVVYEAISYNRKNTPNTSVEFAEDAKKGEIKKEINGDELKAILKIINKDIESYSPTQFVPKNKRTTGLFSFDFVIDLRTLFTVNTSKLNPEIYQKEIDSLKTKGWIEIKYDFGEGLTAPKEIREKLARAISKAIIRWRIQTNQSTTFSPMPLLALAVSNDANKTPLAIRGELTDVDRAKLVVDHSAAKVFTSDLLSAYIFSPKKEADISEAEDYIYNKILEFDFEHQK